MKIFTSFILIISVFFSVNVFSQWATVGAPFFSNSSVSKPFVAVDPYGTPYMAYRNLSIQRLCVMKFDGSSWVYVGTPGFSAGVTDCNTMAFDNTGMPYVAYTDKADHSRATVMKFDGSSWVYVGEMGFTAGAATFTSIAFDNNNIPYVAFRDQGDTVYNSWPNGYRVSVMKFDGTNWVSVGSPAFAPPGNDPAGAIDISLQIDKNNTPYVAFSNFSNGFKATALKFDGSSWVYVGNPAGFSVGAANYTSIAIDNYGVPYVAYVDGANNSRATVMKFDGSNWVPVGSSGFTPGAADNTSLALDVNGTPYVAYEDYANGQRASVMKFDGTNWVQLGVAGFSTPEPSEVYNTTLAIDKSKGILYVGYEDFQYDTASMWPPKNEGTTVMKYELISGVNETTDNFSFSVHPNPAHNKFEVYFSSSTAGKLQLKITDVKGKTVYSENSFCNGEFKKEIDLGKQAKGIYFIDMLCGSERRTRKIILE